MHRESSTAAGAFVEGPTIPHQLPWQNHGLKLGYVWRGTAGTAEIAMAIATLSSGPSDEFARPLRREMMLSQLMARLSNFRSLAPGWDGPDSKPASDRDIQSAMEFARSLPDYVRVPLSYIEADGEIGLFWKTSKSYAEVGFLSGNIAYYARARNGLEIEGEHRFLAHRSQLKDLISVLSRV